jgi:hypothetical protein
VLAAIGANPQPGGPGLVRHVVDHPKRLAYFAPRADRGAAAQIPLLGAYPSGLRDIRVGAIPVPGSSSCHCHVVFRSALLRIIPNIYRKLEFAEGHVTPNLFRKVRKLTANSMEF